MKMSKNTYIILLLTGIWLTLPSCSDLTAINENPNGVSGDKVNLNFIMSTVLTETAKTYTGLGYGDIAGVMQHTQKDAHFDDHNNYEWDSNDWGYYYSILRDNQLVYEKAVEQNLSFHQGVALVMRSFLFSQITDLWGSAPYLQALKGEMGGNEHLVPPYDSQEAIYNGIIADLKEASDLFAQTGGSEQQVIEGADVIYGGDPEKWQKFANSLLLRYLMRASLKMDVQSDFVDIVQNEPIFESNADNALMAYLGNNENDSWPDNTIFDDTGGSDFRRIRPAQTLVEALRERNDPRIDIWFAQVQIPTQLSTTEPHNEIIDGIRYLHPDSVDTEAVNTNQDYVGLPTQMTIPSGYNYNPTPGQTSNNRFVSYLNDRYRSANGPLLHARLMTYTELNFILAEAALKGWIPDAEQYYNEGVRASLEEWTVGDEAGTYLGQGLVAFDGSLERVIEQKWIASWTAAQEAWFDYRRTGYPELQTGPAAVRGALPLRFKYGSNELNFNSEHVSEAIEQLELTNYSQGEKNSPWSKMWLISSTEYPY